MSRDCECSVALPRGAVGLQCVIVVFPDRIHLHFYQYLQFVGFPLLRYSVLFTVEYMFEEMVH